MASSQFTNDPIDTKAGFYSWRLFNMRLREERRRTERSGSSFSLLTLVISDLVDLIEKRPEFKIHQMKKVIANIIRENTRDIDIKSWQNDITLKVLMPETPISGAYVLAEKLQEKISDGFRTFFGLNNVLDLKKNISVISYPEIMKNSNESKELEPLMDKMFMATSRLKWANSDKSTTNLKTEWNLTNQIVLIWPLYSDLFEEPGLITIYKLIKRAIDISGALIGVLLFSPAMLIISILIKTTSPGPILYKQERMGFLGKKFTFLKFRSMYAGCDETMHKEYVINFIKNSHHKEQFSAEDNPLYKMEDDSRVTPFGKFLRKTSLDELPQFFNVLKGEMSLVGPRPPILYEVEQYESWHLRRVLEVKPGMTGLWQVMGRSTTSFNEMVRLDISYVNNWSLWLDLKILFKTMGAVLSTRGAY